MTVSPDRQVADIDNVTTLLSTLVEFKVAGHVPLKVKSVTATELESKFSLKVTSTEVGGAPVEGVKLLIVGPTLSTV